jgi:hypothetical protein
MTCCAIFQYIQKVQWLEREILPLTLGLVPPFRIFLKGAAALAPHEGTQSRIKQEVPVGKNHLL